MFQSLTQRDQVMCILAGIIQQVPGQGALPPIGALVAFIRLDIEFSCEDRAQSNLLASQDAGSQHGIKQVIEAESKVALQAYQVIFGGVEGFLYVWIRKNVPEWREVTKRHRIQQVISIRGGELDQAHLL